MADFTTFDAQRWPDYELLDSGGYEKLERFGEMVLRRPEPQAIWPKHLSERLWENHAHATFRRDPNVSDKGQWDIRRGSKEQWWINYPINKGQLRFRLGLAGFKHVGLFPEQSINWQYLTDEISQYPRGEFRLLNLFAYTGASSIAAAAAGAEVVHVDSVRQVLNWAAANAEANNLTNIRWMPEDALTFVRRELTRGRTYNGIILDPPAYGRGPKGEKWVIEEHLLPLLETCAKLLDPERHLLIVNLYSLGYSAFMVENMVRRVFGIRSGYEFGEVCIPDQQGFRLPLGIILRFSSRR